MLLKVNDVLIRTSIRLYSNLKSMLWSQNSYQL